MEELIEKNKLLNGDIIITNDKLIEGKFHFHFGYYDFFFNINTLCIFYQNDKTLFPCGKWDIINNKPELDLYFDYFNKSNNLSKQYNKIMYREIILDNDIYTLEEWYNYEGSIYYGSYNELEEDSFLYYGEYTYKDSKLTITRELEHDKFKFITNISINDSINDSIDNYRNKLILKTINKIEKINLSKYNDLKIRNEEDLNDLKIRNEEDLNDLLLKQLNILIEKNKILSNELELEKEKNKSLLNK